ncbi:MAG TPA: pilus assembly protein N-terminal domain-containing protein [Candidatus Baltobacteraceae bacterium]|nr:pilus assembly protein N-terminal domain-containing protein [Candidatus Baltobacteraceae bacterium]
MRTRLFGVLLGAVIAALGASAPALADSVSLLSVQSGHSVLVQTPGLSRVAVGDGRIAGVLPIGTSQLVVNGKAPGRTTVFVWLGGHRQTYEITVSEQNMDDLAQMLRTSIDDPGVQIVSFRNSVVVRGVVVDGAHFTSLNDVLGRFGDFAKKQNYTIVNAVTVAHPLGDLQKDLASVPGAKEIRVDPDGKGNVIVSGHVHDAQTAQAILERAKGLAGPYLSADGKLLDRISTDTTSQIDVKVYVLEVDNTAQNDLGIDLNSATFNANCIYAPSCFQFGGPTYPVVESPHGPGGPLKVGPFFRVTTLAPTLHLLMTEGHARLLSAPDLVTLPGNNATFLVGGSVPIPIATGLGQVGIQYEPFGVQLNVTPTLLGNGSVEAKIQPDISDLDFQDGISENGFVVPALKESKLSTDVITQPGESIIMGGMVRRVEQRFINKIPLLGDLPILGKLFRSTNYQHSQSDVVFVMTPTVITR